MEQIAPAEARAIAVARQGFASRNRVATVDDLAATIDRLGCVQLDSVMAVARAHRLTLAARVGRLPTEGLNDLRRSGRIAEVWAHEACLIPARELPFYRAAMLAETQHRWWGPVLDEHARLAAEVMQIIEQDGPATSAEFGGAGRPGWWEWSPAKQVLEALFSSGRLAVRERRGFVRVYDLPERLYAADHLRPIEDAAAVLRHRVLRAVASRGIITELRVADYFRVPGRSRTLAATVEDLVDHGALTRVRVGKYLALAEPATLAELPAESSLAVLLCPFDNLVWDREETDRLFGFRHALEIYTPKAKRRWGYYVLPLLVGNRLVGRVDVTADRKAGLLRLLAVHWESRPAQAALDRAAARLAWTLELAVG